MYFLKFVWFLLFILSASAVRIRTLQSPVHISDFGRKPEPGQHCFFRFLTWNVFIINCFLTEKEKNSEEEKKCWAPEFKLPMTRSANQPFTIRCYSASFTWTRKSITCNHIRTYSRLESFVQSHTSLLTEQNELPF